MSGTIFAAIAVVVVMLTLSQSRVDDASLAMDRSDRQRYAFQLAEASALTWEWADKRGWADQAPTSTQSLPWPRGFENAPGMTFMVSSGVAYTWSSESGILSALMHQLDDRRGVGYASQGWLRSPYTTTTLAIPDDIPEGSVVVINFGPGITHGR
ncbi:type IV pilus biogenesis protein PilM [Salinicola endophyticus]|uniref:Type IV pilus biogenesis protein PilM n=1 Tax=Salinicola endophyticus TaxID=1949083 RepID=A0AB74U7F9_9GAMM